ncbi:hypothetical protein [Flagellimonas crocea]|uniref:hypothetical protein n=1 Tax=Flagellimonas crocea TaxID=3067311 RepID=UPI00296F7263|nr:hypothetical protein [Muricauda sp. DH64]
MEFSMGLVSTILTASIFLPFFYAAYLGRQQNKKIEQFFNKEIIRSGYSFEDYDHWGNTFIGLDKRHSTLVYMRTTITGLLKEEIPMLNVKECVISTEVINKRQNGKVCTHLKKVNLSIGFFGQKEHPLLLNFYDIDGHYMEDHEIARAEKWKNLVLGHCNPLRPLRSAA